MIERQGGGIFHLIEGEGGFDVGYAGYAGQVLHQKSLVSLEVGDDHPQEVIGLPVIR